MRRPRWRPPGNNVRAYARPFTMVLDSLRYDCYGKTATTQGKRDQTILPPSSLLSLAPGSSTGLER